MGLSFPTMPRRRDPWPYSAVLSFNSVTTPVMLLDKPPEIKSNHPDPFGQVAPQDFGYSSQNPAVESTQSYRDLSGGFGLRIQEGMNDRRYRLADMVDCSIAGQMIFGPHITSLTPGTVDSTNGITKFWELGGTLYALNGRYALYRSDDSTWSVSKDFGGGNAGVDVITAKQNTSGSTAYALVGMGDSVKYWYHDGASTTTTWTQHATDYALAWAIKGDELFRAHDVSRVEKVDLTAAFLTSAHWTSNNWRLGDYQYPITRLVIHPNGTLLVLKQDGLHALDSDGADIPLYPGKRFVPAAENGRGSYVDENYVYLTYGKEHFRLNPGLALEPIGPERFSSNDGPVSGYITCGVGTSFAVYAGLYNPDSGHSYLMKFGAYPNVFEGDPKREDAWHGSLSRVENNPDTSTAFFSSRKITAMHVSSIGADSGHERVYIGCSDGTVHWFQLPCTPNPLGCTNYDYSAGGAEKKGYVYLPLWHGGFTADEKVIRAATTFGLNLSSSLYVGKLQLTASSMAAAGRTSYPSSGNFGDDTNKRISVDLMKVVAPLAITVVKSSAAAATATPIVEGLAIHYRTNPQLQVARELNILCEDGMQNHEGGRIGMGAEAIRTAVRNAYDYTAGGYIRLPDGSRPLVQLTGYQERQLFDERTNRWRSVITVTAVDSDTTGSSGVQGLG